MKCDAARPLLGAYADGEASSGQRKAISAHLESCRSCARELRWLSAVKTGLASAPEPSLPPGLTEGLLRLARQGREREAPFWRGLGLVWRMPALASAAALGAGFLILSRFISVGPEEFTLDDALAAHKRYALTMPAADRERLYAELAEEGGDDL